MIRFLKLMGGALLASALVACGGGGGSPGTTNTGTSGQTNTPTVADFTISTDKTVLNTSGTDVATITAVGVDANRNVVENVPVTVTVDHNGVFTPTSTHTDAAGQYTGKLSIGTDTSERDITVKVTMSGLTKSVTVHVSPNNTDFAMFLDKNSMNNAGADTAKLTVVAVDTNRNVVANAPVTVTVDNNGIFTPTAGSTTNSSGVFTGTVSIGSDKRDRDITLTVSVNGLSKTTSVHVGGSKITLQATPSAPAPGQTVTLTLTLADSAGNGIPSSTLTLGGTIPSLQGRTLTTGTSGSVSTTFTAPAAAGIYSITASGNGVSSGDYQIQVFSSVVPAAVIPAGVQPSLSASPNVLPVNAPGSTTNRTTLRFLFLDSNNQPIQYVRVRFDDMTVGLAAVGAQISTGSNVVYTDSAGTVTAQYISGQNSSPTNGVSIRACYSAIDFAAGACPASVTATLTVAGQALSVSIGDDNVLESVNGTYIKQFAVTVADSAGRAVANAPVDISVDLTHYAKGAYRYGASSDDPQSGYGFLDSGGLPAAPLNVVPLSLTAAYPSMNTDTSTQRVWCPNEDVNRNGNVDPTSAFGGTSENYNGSVDSNGQPTLEPRKSDLIISYVDPNVTTTDASGVLLIKVQYSQRFGSWLAYKVRVTANVSGSQGMAEREFVTDVLAADVPNGSFRTPPYGTASCLAPN